MRLPPKDIQKQRQQIAEFDARRRSYKTGASSADARIVALIGWEGPKPRDWGDNIGCWPVMIKYAKTIRELLDATDRATPHVKVVVLEHVRVATEAHARRLKAALDNRLLGEQEGKENAPLRHSWRDINGTFTDEATRGMWWSILLHHAIEDCRRAGDIIEAVSEPTTRKRGNH